MEHPANPLARTSSTTQWSVVLRKFTRIGERGWNGQSLGLRLCRSGPDGSPVFVHHGIHRHLNHTPVRGFQSFPGPHHTPGVVEWSRGARGNALADAHHSSRDVPSHYTGPGADWADPCYSPLFADLRGLPPTLVPSPEERALVLEALQQLDELLDGLPAPVKRAFLLSQMDSLTQRQIAQQLNVTERTVSRHLTRAAEQCHFADVLGVGP